MNSLWYLCGHFNKNRRRFASKKNPANLRDFFYFALAGSSKYFANSVNVVCVTPSTLAIVSMDSHRGWPYFDARFERLNVVGSRPAARAIPLQLKWFVRASLSIAFHNCSFVNIVFSSFCKYAILLMAPSPSDILYHQTYGIFNPI